MTLAFSTDWIFGIITLGCLIFIFQIMMDYSRQANVIRPQLRAVDQIQQRHSDELEKVEKLIKTSEGEDAKLDKRVAELEGKHDELEEMLKGLQTEEEE